MSTSAMSMVTFLVLSILFFASGYWQNGLIVAALAGKFKCSGDCTMHGTNLHQRLATSVQSYGIDFLHISRTSPKPFGVASAR